MSKDKAGEGKENHGLRLATDTVGQEHGGSKKCDGVTAAIRERECVQGPDIPPVGRGGLRSRWPRNPADVPEYLRAEAAGLREYGADSNARTLERAAEIMEWAQMVRDNEPLTLQQAAEESGFTYSTIEKKVANEELENVGEKGRPRVRRGDLPKKGRQPSRAEEPDLVGDLFLKRMSA
jgi:hypothetical protein